MSSFLAHPWLSALLGLAALWAAYLLLARRALRRVLLSDEDRELIRVPLATPGHHVALVHHPASVRRFKTPVLLCHGLAVGRFNLDLHDDGHGSDRTSLARTLSRAGFDVWLLELRGRGHATVPRGANWSIDDEVREDVPAAIAAVLERTRAPDLIWVGHSKGSLLQYLFHARGHPLAGRVRALVAIGSPGTLRYQPWLRRLVRPGRVILSLTRRIPLGALAWTIIPLSGLIHRLGRRFDPALEDNDGPALARILASLPASISAGVARQMLSWIEHSDGAFTTLDGARDEDHYHRLTMPLLLLAGARDYLVPPEAVAFVRDRAGAQDLTFRIAGRAEGFERDYGHGDLLVGSHAPQEVFPLIERWLEAHAEPVDTLALPPATPTLEAAVLTSK